MGIEGSIKSAIANLKSAARTREQDLSSVRDEIHQLERERDQLNNNYTLRIASKQKLIDETRAQIRQEMTEASNNIRDIERSLGQVTDQRARESLERQRQEYQRQLDISKQREAEVTQQGSEISVMQTDKDNSTAELDKRIQEKRQQLPIIQNDIQNLDNNAAVVEQRLANPPPA